MSICKCDIYAGWWLAIHDFDSVVFLVVTIKPKSVRVLAAATVLLSFALLYLVNANVTDGRKEA